MEKLDIEKIEAYLCGKMNLEETRNFENQIQDDPQLKQAVENVAMDLVAIRRVGIARDQAKVSRLRMSMHSASKRMWMSTAAMLAIVFLAAAMVITPVYEFVVAPIIETIKEKQNKPKQPSIPSSKPIITEEEDTIPTDTIIEDEEELIIEEDAPSPIIKEPKVVEDESVPEPEPEPEPVREVVEESKPAEPVTVQQTTPVYVPKINKVISTAQLADYEISPITAKRVGDKVVCSFTMFNKVEDAHIEMHSARAVDGNGKDYNTKYCTLNGKRSGERKKEDWKQNQPHNMEIVIENVDPSITYFTQVSFSFQSEGKIRKQKSQKIVLEVGDIK